MSNNVCAGSVECKKSFVKYFGKLVNSTIAYPTFSADTCTSSNKLCKINMATCPDCMNFITEVNKFLAKPTTIKFDKLADIACNPKASDAKACNDFVQKYGAKALPMVGDQLVKDSKQVCKAILNVKSC